MKILYLADINSVHTAKLIEWVIQSGNTVGIFSLARPEHDCQVLHYGIHAWHPSLFRTTNSRSYFGLIRKAFYLLAIPKLVLTIFKYKPDIIHAHFASSYGLLARIVNFLCPYVLSVWGSDITVFPRKSPLHKKLIAWILNGAVKVAATSQFLATETQKLTKRPIFVTPFGIEVERFSPPSARNTKSGISLICTKGLELIYGQAKLIGAVKILIDQFQIKGVKLHLVGSGSEMENLQNLAKSLKVESSVVFHGRKPNNEIPELLQMSNFAIYPTTTDADLATESFGVAVIEAQAAKLPVIVSKGGGFLELCKDEETGFVLENTEAGSIASKVNYLLANPDLVNRVVANAYQNVIACYSSEPSRIKFLRLYQSSITST